MSAIFDASRWGRLLRSHWAENRRSYAWFAGIAAMADVTLFGLVFLIEGWNVTFTLESQRVWFYSGLFITGVIFAWRYGEPFSHVGATLLSLMRPASAFEKWLMAVLWVAILFPLAYTVLFILIHWPTIALNNLLRESLAQERHFFFPFLDAPHSTWYARDQMESRALEWISLLALTAAQAFFLGGRYYFKKLPFIKTAAFGFLIFIVAFVIFPVSEIHLFSAVNYWMHLEWSPSILEMTVAGLCLIGIPFLLWVAVYYHLRDREVS